MTPKELSRHEDHLRALALRLVQDEHLADDLVQETYVSALERGEAPEKPQRWLRETLRLKARHARTSEESRAKREQAAAIRHSSATVDVSDSEAAAALNALREELDELDEPYRSTLRARFVEGLPPREIAARAKLPVRTVNTRITRGVRKLRERLDRRLGATWLPLLAFVVDRRSPLVSLRRMPRALSRALSVGGAAAAMVVILAAGWWVRSTVQDPVAGVEQQHASTSSPSVAQVPSAAAPVRGQRAEPEPAPELAPISAPLLRGTVVDLEGRPVADLDVLLDRGTCTHDEPGLESFAFQLEEPAVARATSDAQGSFAIAIEGLGAASRLLPESTRGRLTAGGHGYHAVLGEIVPTPGGSQPLTLITAPERSVRGLVVDADGLPVAEATVTAYPSDTYLASLSSRARTWLPILPTTRTEADGSFELATFDMPKGRLQVRHDGYLTTKLTLAEGPCDVRVELHRTPRSAAELRGRVVNASGAPIEGALVVAGSASAQTLEDGTFHLGPGRLHDADVLWAVAPELCPAQLPLDRAADGQILVPSELTLTLAEPSLSIEGVVLDATGAPLPGAHVWCADATHLGGVRRTLFAEGAMFAGEGEWGMPHAVTADDAGRFRLPFLADRTYRVGSIVLSTLVSSVSEPVPAGTKNLVLRLPTEEARTPVSGLVLTRDGDPIPGVRVTVKRTTLDARIGANGSLRAALTFDSVETDEDGWFLFDALPRTGLHLVFEGDHVLPDKLDIPADASRERIEEVLARRARVRVHVTTGRRIDHVALVDRRGIKLPIFDASDYASNSGYAVRTDVGLHGRGSVLVIAPDTAVALVAYGGGTIVESVPVVLSADGTLEINL